MPTFLRITDQAGIAPEKSSPAVTPFRCRRLLSKGANLQGMCPVYFFTHLLSLVPAADAAAELLHK